MNRLVTVLSLVISGTLVQTGVFAQTRERASVPEKFLWKLEDVYASDTAWAAAKEKVAGQFDRILAFKGQLASSPKQLLACLQLDGEISKELARLSVYASMKSDQDTRVSKYQGLKEELQKLATDYRSKASFIAPEIVALDQATIDGWLAQEAALRVYQMYLNDLQRTKSHRLSTNEEKILAEAGLMASAPLSAYKILSNAELPFSPITLSDGTQATLNQAGFAKFRVVRNAADREAVFEKFFGAMDKFQQTFGSLLSSQVKEHMFYARARHYESSLHMALDSNNIPVGVYHALIQGVHKHLNSFHRYLRLKQRMLGVAQLKYSDLYVPVVKDVDLEYSYEAAEKLVLDALQPLGEEYTRVIQRAFNERWIDVFPTPAKRSGAYCDGCYDVHPYVLLNYNGQYHDVSTLAHELGHAMHSYKSNKTQPYATADYATFVAEVASTLNEALLMDKLLRDERDDNVRLSLLMSYLDGVKGTVFRQTQFAEFELAIHEQAEHGEPLTGEVLTRLYGEILKQYYGHEQGLCQVDPRYYVEWTAVPHFYFDFYVYQYSTSFTASTTLSEKILKGEKGAVQRTMEFLSAGGSDYPVAILKKAGVDMLTSEPLDNTMTMMNRVMDQIEAILAKQADRAADQTK